MVQQQTSRSEWHSARDELRKEALLAENAVELARSQLEVERRRSQQLADQLAAAERRLALVSDDNSSRGQRRPSSCSVESIESPPRTIRQQSSSASLYALLRDSNASSGAALMEHMQVIVLKRFGLVIAIRKSKKETDSIRYFLVTRF